MSDLIDRQEAIEALNSTCGRVCQYSKKQRSVMCSSCPLGSALDVLDELPTAERRGKWIERHHAYSDEEMPIEEWQSARCSVCGKYHTTPYLYYFNEYKYCPNCGARMDEVEE